MADNIRNLIFTADDYGACDFIDRGVLKAIDEGVVTTVSAFINFKKRSSTEPGEAYVGSAKAIAQLRDLHPHFPIGLHLTINTGTPILKNHEVPELIGNSIHGVRYFNTFEQFTPNKYFTPHILKQIGNEVRAQIKEFKRVVGEVPNHISCHFGVLFIFQNFLEEILKEEGISGIPVRNPIIAFQTPNKEKGRNKTILSKAKKFFKKNSKMRESGTIIAKEWLLDSLDSAVGVLTKATANKKKLNLLMKHRCHFPDYTMDSLYKRGKNGPVDFEGGLASFIGQIPPFIPEFYTLNKNRKGGVCAEFICHLGDGPLPASAPEGINLDYFAGRKLELDRLVNSQMILATNSINLVDFDFLEDHAVA